MEITPKNYLDNGFEILRDALKPFIYKKLHKHYGIAWWEKGVIDKLYHTEQLPLSGSDPELIGHLDLYELIRVFQANYKEVFYNYFKSYSPQNYSTFLVDARNGNSHQNDFNKIDKIKVIQALANSNDFLNAINIDKLSYIKNAIIEIGIISKELLGEPQKRQVVGMGVIQENSETIKQPTSDNETIDCFCKLLLERFRDDDVRKKCLATDYEGTTSKARPKYWQILAFTGDKFSNEFIELVYETLEAWGMNKRDAKLSEFNIFKNSIINSKDILLSLEKYVIGDIEENIKIQDTLKEAFFKLQLVATNAPLVTFSKTMHFFFRDLIAPIDRTYTKSFFRKSFPSNISQQWDYFINVEKAYSWFSNHFNIAQHIDTERNKNIPKILDNLVIGYTKLHKKVETQPFKPKNKKKVKPSISLSDFEKIIEKWNASSKMKTDGKQLKKKKIPIPEIHMDYKKLIEGLTPVYYVFEYFKTKISIGLDCTTKQYPNFDKTLLSFDGLNIDGNIFKYSISNRHKNEGWKGILRTEISLSDVDSAVEIMKKLIEKTKEAVILACKKQQVNP